MTKGILSMAMVFVIALSASFAQAAIIVHSDYDFADNTVPGVFSNAYGSGPATGGGVLTFNGTTAIRATTSTIYGGSAPANNYGYEIIMTPSAVNNTFDIFAGIVAGDATNKGNFIFAQDLGGGPTGKNYSIIEAGEGWGEGSTDHTVAVTVALAFVMDNGTARLFVNGVQEATRVFSAGGTTPIDTATLAAVTLGGDLNAGTSGAMEGTIDRARWFTFNAGQFSAADLLGPNDGTIPAVIPEPALLCSRGSPC